MKQMDKHTHHNILSKKISLKEQLNEIANIMFQVFSIIAIL